MTANGGIQRGDALEAAAMALHDMRTCADVAVERMRELDTIDPEGRRKLVAAVDDLAIDTQRIRGALQRVLERANDTNARRAAVAAGLPEGAVLVPPGTMGGDG